MAKKKYYPWWTKTTNAWIEKRRLRKVVQAILEYVKNNVRASSLRTLTEDECVQDVKIERDQECDNSSHDN